MPTKKKKEKKIFIITTLRFGFKYGNAKRSGDGKYHSFEKRTSKTQKEYFTIVRSRSWGYYRTLKNAKRAIEENWADMYEGDYTEAVIEACSEGILMGITVSKEYWYKWVGSWKKGGYKPWKKPKEYHNVVGFWGS